MTKAEIRPATLDDAQELAGKMRPADAAEVEKAGGFTPYGALVESMDASEGHAYALLFDGDLVALFGIVQYQLLADVAFPWLLTGHGFERSPRAALSVGRDVMAVWQRQYPMLMQMVDAEYTSAHRFLKALGFTIGAPVPHGASGAPFCPAVRSRHV